MCQGTYPGTKRKCDIMHGMAHAAEASPYPSIKPSPVKTLIISTFCFRARSIFKGFDVAWHVVCPRGLKTIKERNFQISILGNR